MSKKGLKPALIILEDGREFWGYSFTGEGETLGEVMGLDRDFGLAFAKAQLAAGFVLPESGTVFISVADPHKDALLGQVPYITTIRGAKAAVEAIRSTREKGIEVTPLQEYHRYAGKFWVLRRERERAQGSMSYMGQRWLHR